MGRAKQRMELISNEKARYVTYQKRKKGLKKKTCELETLCDVQVCLIIYGPTMNDHPTEVETWPSNPDDIHRSIDSYKNQSSEDRRRRTLDLSNFFENRNQKIEETLVKLRKKNDKAIYSTWDDRYNDLSEKQLRELNDMLEIKLVNVKARVEFIKSTQALTMVNHSNNFMQGLFLHDLKPVSSLNNEVDIAIHQYPFSQTDQQLGFHELDPLMMMPMNNAQFGGMSSSNLQYINNPLDRSIYFDPIMLSSPESALMGVSCTESPFFNHHPLASMGSNTQTMSPYLQYLKMANAQPQVHAWQMEEYYKASEFQMKNQK